MNGAHLEGLYGDVAGVGVELLLRVLLVVTLACIPTFSDQHSLYQNRDSMISKSKIARGGVGDIAIKTVRTLKLYAYPVGDRLDALRPERLVELGVEADVLGAHGLLGELDDRLYGMGGTLLEGAAVDALVEVDGVLAGHDILERRARLAGLLLWK